VQFSCDSCKTQLQIADEKVRGKRLVVRCRRCGAKITIADPALAGKLTKPAPAKPAAVPASPAPVAASRAAASQPAAAPTATPGAAAKPADGWAPKTSPAPAAPAATPSKQGSSQQAPAQQPASQRASSQQPKRTTDTENTLAMDSAMLERALLASKEEDPELGSTRPPAPDVAEPADPPLWFAMLQGKQVGPLARSDVEARVFAGEVGPRTYLWKEGMDAWQRAKEVPELSSLFPAPPEEAKPVPAVPAPAPDEPADRSEERVEGGVPDELFTPGATHSNSDLASWANTDLGRQTNPAAEPGLQLAQQPPQRARASTPMFESAAPTRSRGGFGIVIFAILAAVAVGGWIFFGQEQRRHALAAVPEATADAATAEAAPSPSDAAVAEAAPVPEKPAPKATGLTADQVRKKLDDNKPALQTCVDDALKRDPKLRAGKIHVVATIAPSGQVTGVKIDKRSIDEAPLGACLKRTTRKIAFPSFEGDPFDVDIPIVVTAGE
jgi:predicted Zn finger-like uncharacterized protein